MPNSSLISEVRPKRRTFVHASFLTCISGCSAGYFYRESGTRQTLFLLTPWPDVICKKWSDSLSRWLKTRNLPEILIQWQYIPENQIRHCNWSCNQNIDGLIGGHYEHHRTQSNQKNQTLIYSLKPVRQIAVCPINNNSSQVISNSSWASTTDINNWGNSGHGLLLGNPSNDDISNSYLQAIWNAAPNDRASFSRWILICRFLEGIRPSPKRLELIEFNQEASQSGCQPLIPNDALMKSLGVETSQPIHWPEGLSLQNPKTGDSNAKQLMIDFCKDTNRLNPLVTLASQNAITDSFRRDLAGVVVHENLKDIRKSWRIIEPTGGEIRSRAESYLTTPPPWPPASITDLQRKRGFEYVVALVEQLAANGDQRDWLIREFQTPISEIDTQKLDAAMSGDLLRNIRFRAWLRAEWKAWIWQRCRRIQRFILEGNELAYG